MPALLFEDPDCVFIRIPKTGSTSVICGLLKNSHQLQKILSHQDFPEDWDAKFSFAFVRDPHRRFVSAMRMFKSYRTANRNERRIQASLSLDTIMDIVEDDTISIERDDFVSKLRLHHLPMTHPRLMLDKAKYVAVFENFQEEILKLASLLGITNPEIPHLRDGGNYDHKAWFTPKELSRFDAVFRFDLEYFHQINQGDNKF